MVAAYEPDYATPPGWTLQEVLDERSMNQADLARRTGLSPKLVSQIVNGRAPITAATAVRLERATGIPARLWANLESRYREHQVRLSENEDLARQVDFLEELPIREMVRMGLLTEQAGPIDRLREVLNFFGVAGVGAWRAWADDLLGAASFRKPPSSSPGSLELWLRLGEVGMLKVPCAPWNRTRFRAVLDQARTLTRHPDSAVWSAQLIEECASAGVALVPVPDVSGAEAQGASRWVAPDRALIQFSDRCRWSDVFWFSFFHDARRVLDESKRRIYIHCKVPDADSDPSEEKADSFAQDLLIPPRSAPRLQELATPDDVIRFAADLGIHPGIVVGRLQREGIWAHHTGNSLRQQLVVGGGGGGRGIAGAGARVG